MSFNGVDRRGSVVDNLKFLLNLGESTGVGKPQSIQVDAGFEMTGVVDDCPTVRMGVDSGGLNAADNDTGVYSPQGNAQLSVRRRDPHIGVRRNGASISWAIVHRFSRWTAGRSRCRDGRRLRCGTKSPGCASPIGGGRHGQGRGDGKGMTRKRHSIAGQDESKEGVHSGLWCQVDVPSPRVGTAFWYVPRKGVPPESQESSISNQGDHQGLAPGGHGRRQWRSGWTGASATIVCCRETQTASANPFHSGAGNSINLPPSASNSVARS